MSDRPIRNRKKKHCVFFFFFSESKKTHSLNGIVRDGDFTTDSSMNILHLEMDSFKLGSLIVGDRGDEVLDTANEDLAVGSNKPGH